MYVSKIVFVPSVNVRSQVSVPTLKSCVFKFVAPSVAVIAAPPPSTSVIHVAHEPAPFLAKVTSAPSSSVAVRVILAPTSSATEEAVASPSPSLDKTGASFTAVTVITNVSVTDPPAPSEVVHVIPYVLSESDSASIRAAAVAVPPRVAWPPESAVSVIIAGISKPVSTQAIDNVSPSTSVD